MRGPFCFQETNPKKISRVLVLRSFVSISSFKEESFRHILQLRGVNDHESRCFPYWKVPRRNQELKTHFIVTKESSPCEALTIFSEEW